MDVAPSMDLGDPGAKKESFLAWNLSPPTRSQLRRGLSEEILLGDSSLDLPTQEGPRELQDSGP